MPGTPNHISVATIAAPAAPVIVHVTARFTVCSLTGSRPTVRANSDVFCTGCLRRGVGRLGGTPRLIVRLTPPRP